MPSTSMQKEHSPISYGTFRFVEEDLSIPASERSFFATPAKKEVKDIRLPLYDYRSDYNITKGPAGLDAHGFTVVNHKSALTGEDFLGPQVEDIYLKECEELVKQLTGAKATVVNNVALRRKLATEQMDKGFYYKRGHPMDVVLGQSPRDKPLVFGNVKDANASVEPARTAHVDYTPTGLRNTVRHCRSDIRAAGKSALDAWDNKSGDDSSKAPRVAAYSVWRPLKAVKRDPLAVALYGTIDENEVVPSTYRALSDNADGEYLMEAWAVKPPKDDASAQRQKWYWVPDQTPGEVLVIKFADTGAEVDPEHIAAYGAHVSPIVEGTPDDAEPRESIEARIIAFW